MPTRKHAVRFFTLRLMTVVLGLGLVVLSGPAHAEVRRTSVCPAIRADFPSPIAVDGQCFSGHPCTVGVRGDWLDLTDRATVISAPPDARDLRIMSKGVEPSAIGSCIPQSNKDREGYVRLFIDGITTSGDLTIRLSRPAIGGRDGDTVTIPVKRGETFVSLKRNFSAEPNVPETFTITGGNLDRLQLRNPMPGDRIISASETEARIELTYPRTGRFSLEERLQFAAEPALNAAFGWPFMSVRNPTNGVPVAPPPAPRPITGGSSSTPNLTPVVLFPTRPLIRKINRLESTMVSAVFCTGLGNNEERTVNVPDFQWGVANDDKSDIASVFSVAVLNGVTNGALTTQQVTALRENDSTTFRNWSGRPTTITVVKVTGPPLMAEYQNSIGCYIPNRLAGSTTLDPTPLIIRVDSGAQITESNEVDNDTRM